MNKKKKKNISSKNSKLSPGPVPSKTWPYLLLILGITLAVYFPVFENELVNWDDHAYIRDNPLIRDLSADNIRHLFKTSTFVIGNYHPLTVLTYCIEYKYFGLNPAAYHTTNLLLHMLNISLFFFFILQFSGNRVITLVSSFLFALHPMRVESVAWAAERKDVLYMFFFLLSLIAYFFYQTKTKNNIRFYALSFLFFILSCFSKGQAVVLPLTFFLVDYFLRKPLSLKSLWPKLPFLAVSVFFGIIALGAQHTSLTEQRLESHTMAERVFFASYNLVAYLYKLVSPYSLSCFYGYPQKVNGALPLVFYLSPLPLAGFAFLVWKYFRNTVPVVFGLLFFIFTISIVIQLLPVGDAIIADRYTYVPYMGLFFIAGYMADHVLSAYASRRKLIWGILFLQAAVFCYFSFRQVKSWKNSETLWTHVLKNNPEEPVAYYDRGMYYLDNNELDKAFSDFQNAIKFKPTYYDAYNSLGTVYERKNENDKALEYYGKSLALQPGYAIAYFNRGITYNKISRFDLAAADFTKVIELEPNNANAWYSRGISYRGMNAFDKAIPDYEKAIALNPGFSDAYVNLGNVYYNQNLFDKAIEQYNKAIQIDPRNTKAILNRSQNYFLKREFQKAIDDAKKVQELGENVDPKYFEELYRNLNASPSPAQPSPKP